MNLLYPAYDSDLCDIDNVLSLGFFDLDCGDDSLLLEGKKEDPLKEELLLEKHDPACALSLKVTCFQLQILKKADMAALPPQFGLRMKEI